MHYPVKSSKPMQCDSVMECTAKNQHTIETRGLAGQTVPGSQTLHCKPCGNFCPASNTRHSKPSACLLQNGSNHVLSSHKHLECLKQLPAPPKFMLIKKVRILSTWPSSFSMACKTYLPSLVGPLKRDNRKKRTHAELIPQQYHETTVQ